MEERTNTFRVRAVVPMTAPWADRELMPEFPGVAKAEIIILSVPDALLKGATNEKLVRHVRSLNRSAKIVATADVLADVAGAGSGSGAAGAGSGAAGAAGVVPPFAGIGSPRQRERLGECRDREGRVRGNELDDGAVRCSGGDGRRGVACEPETRRRCGRSVAARRARSA